MSKIVPNTFQCFNAYVDRAMQHLTDAELRVLLYASRHIMGWQDKISSRMGHISLEMFEHGFDYTDDDGNLLHFAGCGLRRNAISKALGSLCDFGFLERIGLPTEKGQRWLLGSSPNWDKLETRSSEIAARNQKRLAKANEALMIKRGQSSPEVSSHDMVSSDDTTPISLHDTTPISSDEHKQNQVQNQVQNQHYAPADAGAAGDGEILNQPTSKNEEKSSHSDTTASGDTQEPPSSATPPKQKRQRKPNPLFDPIYNAIEHGFWEIEDSAGAFSPDDDKDNGGRISKVAWWHCGKSYKGVRTIGNPATLDTVQMHVEAIKKFATWVRAKGITIHDIAKYVEWYGKWVSEVKMQSQRRQSKAVHAPARPVLTDEQRAENLRKLQEARDAALNTDKEAV
jgi:hypothetical protein